MKHSHTQKNPQQNKPTDQGILKKPFRSIQHCLPQVCLKKRAGSIIVFITGILCNFNFILQFKL